MPVFIIKDNKPVLIGTTYSTVGRDWMNVNNGWLTIIDDYIYYNEDLPNYLYYRYGLRIPIFYQIYRLKNYLSINFYKLNLWGGFGSNTVKDEIFINQMVELIKPIPKYQHIIEFINKKKNKKDFA